MPPKLSIIIPNYNGGAYLEETLSSIFVQDYENYEVIVQDGGSTDNSVRIVKKYSSKYPRKILWESVKDKGQLDALKKGIKKAKGDVICFINSDDIFLPNAFSEVGNAFGDKNILWAAGQGIVINEKGDEISKWASIYKKALLKANRLKLLHTVNYLMQPSVFISKEAYRKYGPFTGKDRYVMEYDLWLKLGRVSMPFLIEQPLSAFRLRKGSFSTSKTKEILKEDTSIVKKYTNNSIIIAFHKLHNYIRYLQVNS